MKKKNSRKDVNHVKDSIDQDIRKIIQDHVEVNKPANEKLSYEKFERIVIDGTYLTAKYILLTYVKDTSIMSEHQARTYADNTPAIDGTMIHDMYHNYINNIYSYEACVEVAVDILTNLFCVMNGFPPPNKGFKVVKKIYK